MKTPIWIRSATRGRAYNAKYAVHQHPRSKKYHQRRERQTRIRERHKAEDNSTDASNNRHSPIAFQSFDHHFFFLARPTISEKHKIAIYPRSRRVYPLALIIHSFTNLGSIVRLA